MMDVGFHNVCEMVACLLVKIKRRLHPAENAKEDEEQNGVECLSVHTTFFYHILANNARSYDSPRNDRRWISLGPCLRSAL